MEITLSINISPIHLFAKNFLEKLSDSVQKHNVLPEQIYVEITENLMLEGDVTTHLEKIQYAGFKLSLDDFGTGYSSLNYLREFSFDELKIDKSFVDGIPDDQNDISIVLAIIGLSKNLGYENIAEGIENKEQEEFLLNNGCLLGQGFYFSRPKIKDESIEFIKES